MAYSKQNFNDGDILTAEHLNNIENGIVQNETDMKNKADLDENGMLKAEQLPNNALTDEDKDEIEQQLSALRSGGKILWQGTDLMADGASAITLSESVFNQTNGIVLVFSYYNNGAAQNSAFQHFFVARKFIESSYLAGSGKGVGSNFFLHANGFICVGTKYLYISETKITGYDANDDVAASESATGIKYSNDKFCLRYVIGV